MSEKKRSHNNRFRSNVFTDSLENLLKLISSKRNYIIAGSVLSLGIALGSGLETDRYAKKWLKKEVDITLQPALEEIEKNKNEQITKLEEELNSDLAEKDALIQGKRNELANRHNDIYSQTNQELKENDFNRQNIRKNYENEIIKMNDEDELDERVKKAVEQETRRTYPTDGCWWRLWNDRARCKYSERRYKELKPDIELQIKKEIAIKEQELEQKLREFKQKDQAIIAEGEKKKADVRAGYNEDIKDIEKDKETFRQEFKKQEDSLIQKAIVDKKVAEEKIEKDINRQFLPTTLRAAKISAILGSIFGAMTTILLLLLLAEYVFLKSAISDKLWFKRYKSFVSQFWAILLICCSVAISLELFTAKTEQEKEQITWIALPTARSGAIISSISCLLSSGFLIQALLASKNPITKEQKRVNSDSALQQLDLSEDEIEDYSGLHFYVERDGKKRKNIVDNVAVKANRFFLYVLCSSCVLYLLIFGSFPISIKIGILGVIFLLLFFIKVFFEYWLRRKRRKLYADYISLREDYLNFRNHIKAIEQIDSLGQEIPDRLESLNALEQGRTTLINAFRAEQILRDDPYNNDLPEILNSSMNGAFEISEKAHEYSNTLKDIVQTNLAIQKEVQNLYHKVIAKKEIGDPIAAEQKTTPDV